MPEGNFIGEDPGFTARGAKPWPYHAPLGAEAFLVDRGIDAGFPFDGAAPGLGAYELGDGHEPIVPLNGGQN